MEDFVSFDLAKKLKEKGFREECYAYYSYSESLKFYIIQDAAPSRQLTINDFKGCKNCYIENGKYDAPTISQVLKWLREEKNVVFVISPMQEMDCDYLGWCVTIYKVADDGYGLSWQEELYYDSYESAALAGIEYVIDNLI